VRLLQGLQSIDAPKKSGGAGGAGRGTTEMNDALIPGVGPVVSPPPGGLPPLERESSSKFR
jgi:hypothetical protein